MEVDFFQLSGDVWYLQAAALNFIETRLKIKKVLCVVLISIIPFYFAS